VTAPHRLRRRRFLATAASALCVPTFIPRGVLASAEGPGANDRILTGVIGTGRRIGDVINSAPRDIQIAALADCDLRRMAANSQFGTRVKRQFPDKFDKMPRYQDHRQMLDREKLDAVFVGTTTHARVFCAIHAVQAGLDAYCEKAVALTVEEGRALVTAARKHKRIVQVGTQAASFNNNKLGTQLVRDGGLGKVEKVVTVNFLPGKEWTSKPAKPIPDGLNWDMWCNQAPLLPYNAEDFHPGCEVWGWWTLFDNGGQSWGMSGWGTHALDQVQRGLGTEHTGPVEVIPEKPGDPVSPITMVYANGVRLEMKLPKGSGPAWGAIFLGEKGKVEINRWKVVSNPVELTHDLPHVPARQHATPPHVQNWVDAMRSRELPNADIEIGHRATTLCCLASAARELGRSLKWDPQKEQVAGDDEANANRWLTRPRHAGYELPEV